MLRSDYEKQADCRASQLKGHLKAKVLVTQSCPTLCNPMDYSLCAWTSPGKNIGMGSLSLLQGILQTQGWNMGLPHCGQILYHLSHQGKPQRTFSHQVLGPLGFIHSMASFKLLLIRPLENSVSLATLRQPEVSPRTAWEALVARNPEVAAARGSGGSLSHAVLSIQGLQRALVWPPDTPGSCVSCCGIGEHSSGPQLPSDWKRCWRLNISGAPLWREFQEALLAGWVGDFPLGVPNITSTFQACTYLIKLRWTATEIKDRSLEAGREDLPAPSMVPAWYTRDALSVVTHLLNWEGYPRARDGVGGGTQVLSIFWICLCPQSCTMADLFL